MKETLEQAVSRIAKAHHLVHFVQGEDGYGGEDEVDSNAEAALREMAAFVRERDAQTVEGIDRTSDTLKKIAAAIRRGE